MIEVEIKIAGVGNDGSMLVRIDDVKSVINSYQERIKELEQAQNQLLSLIYNTAVGNVAMGYPVDIESLASEAYEITGINAEQVKTQQSKVK